MLRVRRALFMVRIKIENELWRLVLRSWILVECGNDAPFTATIVLFLLSRSSFSRPCSRNVSRTLYGSVYQRFDIDYYTIGKIYLVLVTNLLFFNSWKIWFSLMFDLHILKCIFFFKMFINPKILNTFNLFY